MRTVRRFLGLCIVTACASTCTSANANPPDCTALCTMAGSAVSAKP